MIPAKPHIPTVRFEAVSRRYKSTKALDNVSLTLEPGKVYGLLGRNGAGKTTLMSILDAQAFPTSGRVLIDGKIPAENARVLQQICFIRENQKYPDQATVPTVLRTASWFFPGWDDEMAHSLADVFELPKKTPARKLSRGQASALSLVVGLASHAGVTIFDEPYLGLDATARELFYQALLADLDAHPRTVLISSHLIDEIATLINHVLLLDHGKLRIDEDVLTLMDRAHSVTGPSTIVEDFCKGLEVLKRESLGGISRYQVLGDLSEEQKTRASSLGLTREALSLQSLTTAIAAAQSHDVPEQVGASR